LPSVPQCISTPVVTANVISACQEINRPGDYVLSGDIHAGVLSDSGCLNVHDTASVNIDCQGHTINTPAGVKFENVQNFSLKNCVIVGLGSPNPYPLVVRTSRDGTISNNTLGEINSNVVYTFNIDRGDGLLISENRINSVLQQYLSKDNTISANTFVSPVSLVRGKIIPGCVISTFGTNNLITGNTIDGRAIGGGVSVADDSGADDGIILMDESATTVSNNSIRNVWDAGIEWLGLLDRVTIIGNTITNALYTGIGGWYFMGLAHSTISRNIVSRTPRLFVISRTYGLRPAGYDPRNPSAPEKAIYFTNNRFESNVLANPVPDGQTAVAHTEIFVFSNNNQLGYTGYPGGGNIAPRPSDFILTDNVFINNDFSKDAGSPFFGVSNSMWGIIIDGGGNRCSYDRLNMFSPNYPLNCN
jgi:hypothetical protein